MSTPVIDAKPSLWHRLYHGETHFDFVGKRAGTEGLLLTQTFPAVAATVLIV